MEGAIGRRCGNVCCIGCDWRLRQTGNKEGKSHQTTVGCARCRRGSRRWLRCYSELRSYGGCPAADAAGI